MPLPIVVYAQPLLVTRPTQNICDIVPHGPTCVALRKRSLATSTTGASARAPIREAKEPDDKVVDEVAIRAKPPPRSASDWQVDPDTIRSIPHETGADVLGTLPGVYVSNRGLLGQAPHLSLRGFEGAGGQDVELWVGSVPMNQISNLRAPGYADLRLVMPEVIRDVRISHGPYDPRQGDYAIAGSAHMDLGLERPGFLAEGTLGSFNTRRVLLAFAPGEGEWRDSFAAVEAYGTDGPGAGRGGQRASLVGQLAFVNHMVEWRGTVVVGTARFDFPGLLSLADVQRGQDPYAATSPLGRDLASQAHLGNELTWDIQGGTMRLMAYVSLTNMQLYENLTGYAQDVLAGLPPQHSDDAEQVNQATTYGLGVSYRHLVKILTDRDLVEMGASTRIDSIQQSDTRLNPDGTIYARNVDASIGATGIAGYVDAALYPIPRVVIRGGTRIDALSYSVDDKLGNEGIERTTQGLHVGNKATVDYASGRGVHWVASYGEGFRSPEARSLVEGEKIPFATIQSFEAGARAPTWQHNDAHASLVGFASWLSQDLVFDGNQRAAVPAPSSRRLGVAATVASREGILGVSASGTYARATFTGSDADYARGATVPYAPSFVMRSDLYLLPPLGHVAGSSVGGRFGVGMQGAFGASLPDGTAATSTLYIDALASASWRAFELSVNGMNLLNRKYDDLEYVYASNFQKSATLPAPSAHVLVAPPASIFVTLKVHIDVGG